MTGTLPRIVTGIGENIARNSFQRRKYPPSQYPVSWYLGFRKGINKTFPKKVESITDSYNRDENVRLKDNSDSLGHHYTFYFKNYDACINVLDATIKAMKQLEDGSDYLTLEDEKNLYERAELMASRFA